MYIYIYTGARIIYFQKL